MSSVAMKRVSVVLIALTIGGGILFGQRTPLLRAQAPVVVQEELPELAEQMALFGRSFRRLRRQVSNPEKRDQSLELTLKMQDVCQSAKLLAPSNAEGMGAEAKAKFVLGYRKEMIELMEALLELEVALLEENFEGAGKAFERVHEIEEEGHAEFRDGGE